MNETVLLRNQIAALTKERDEWMRSLEFSLKQRDELNAERDELRSTINAACISAIRQEREIDALKDAARLALVALEGVVDFDPDSKAQWSVSGGAYEAHECNSAINALKAVL